MLYNISQIENFNKYSNSDNFLLSQATMGPGGDGGDDLKKCVRDKLLQELINAIESAIFDLDSWEKITNRQDLSTIQSFIDEGNKRHKEYRQDINFRTNQWKKCGGDGEAQELPENVKTLIAEFEKRSETLSQAEKPLEFIGEALTTGAEWAKTIWNGFVELLNSDVDLFSALAKLVTWLAPFMGGGLSPATQ
jgi:hypothetical protein